MNEDQFYLFCVVFSAQWTIDLYFDIALNKRTTDDVRIGSIVLPPDDRQRFWDNSGFFNQVIELCSRSLSAINPDFCKWFLAIRIIKGKGKRVGQCVKNRIFNQYQCPAKVINTFCNAFETLLILN